MALGTNLISYYKLDGNSNDAVGSNNGTDTAITYNTANGKINQGAGFNGTTSKIVIADASSLKPTGNFSISAWVKSGYSGINMCIFQSFADAGSVFAGIFLGITTGHVQFFLGDNAGHAPQFNVGAVTDGNWHFLVATYDGTNMNIYIDAGTPTQLANTYNPAYQATNYIRLGCGNFTGTDNSFTNGSIDEVGIWSRALTSGEVTSLWNGGAGLAYPFATVYTMVTAPASFTYTPQSSGDPVTRNMTTAKATFTLTGMASGFKRVMTMITSPATYVLTGMASEITIIIKTVIQKIRNYISNSISI